MHKALDLRKEILKENLCIDLCVFVCSSCPAGTCDGCTFYFLWESASACPRCTEDDYHRIEGACKGGVQVARHSTAQHSSVLRAYGDLCWLHSFCNSLFMSLFSFSRKRCMYGMSRSCAPKGHRYLPEAPPPARPSPCG